ncbi:alpha/beta hydrolase [Leptolyngbya sp. 'hensonii']|uniref:alpha/beta fold hydrolase n=1 Tax=Leptolyngbya sp. 'hensonii' TaxID=1922337 RepID=UPI0009501F00|nr:alpha/beta fold hydrolase [Leptolyngbya sp. 'hensonii']OLP17155.1 alpha/beta hydrolase [Leptolyngbya sp. 'hensonii']
MATPSILPTPEQIQQAQQAISAYVQEIDANPERRDGAYPYALFHEAGQPIFGTVLMFHGFSAKPHQMWRLADYLFQNGFNVYQVTLAGHASINPGKNWPQVDLRPEIADPLKQKIQADPVLQNYLNNQMANPQSGQNPSYMQRIALMHRLLKIEPRLLDIKQAIEKSDDPDFDRYFISSHMNYLIEARRCLEQLASIPGPVYTVGLSVGGATALGLAADQPDRIQRTVAYAPLLKVYGEENRQYVNLAGPLDIKEVGWDPNLQFPLGAFTAADRFGSAFVLKWDNVEILSRIPTFLVLTENEDAADIETNKQFFKSIGGDSKGHRHYLYPTSDLVPHPMVDPTEVSQNMSNRFWQSLYQETYRFLTTGDIDPANLGNVEQNPELPIVPSVTP